MTKQLNISGFFRFGMSLMAFFLLVGCSPSTWPGINKVTGKRGDDAVIEAEPEPVVTEKKRSWWKIWGRRAPESDGATETVDVAGGETEKYSSNEFVRATQLVRGNRFTEAKPLLLEELKHNPNNAAAYRWLGDCHYNLLELPQAIVAYSQARNMDPTDYFALRGKGFAHLHRGHELWRQQEKASKAGNTKVAKDAFSEAHENYLRSLELLQQCLVQVPGDSEAMYGRAMAAEGASRKVYSLAVRLLAAKRNEEAKEWAANCLKVIGEGIDAARIRVNQHPEESGPRALVGGLFLRRAMLLHKFGQNVQAIIDLKNARKTQKSILDFDARNAQAIQELKRCDYYLKLWEQEGATPPPPPPA